MIYTVESQVQENLWLEAMSPATWNGGMVLHGFTQTIQVSRKCTYFLYGHTFVYILIIETVWYARITYFKQISDSLNKQQL